jgi:hypothetical protein
MSNKEICFSRKGSLYRKLSEAVIIWFVAGNILVVRVRNIMVKGSRINKVKLPNRAATMIVRNIKYFTPRHPSEGGFAEGLRQRSKENRSKIVPSGHSQPHQARPKTRVSRIISKEIEDASRKARLDSRCVSVIKGSSRMGRLRISHGVLARGEVINKARKINNARYCTLFRTVIQISLGVLCIS